MSLEKNEKISVVVPIYNVEEYLPRCLDSIVAQTYTNIEIMLVDDGSPDNAGAICDEYVARDSRIRVFHIPNGGVAKARQLGVESSTGEYIVFVDPDDWLPLNSIETLYSNITPDVDIVIGGHKYIHQNKILYSKQVEVIFDSNNYINKVIAWDLEIAPWGKIYRRSLFSKNSFPNLKHTQDWLMNIEISFNVHKVRTIKYYVYNYFTRQSSTSNLTKDSFEYKKNFCHKIKSIIERHNKFDTYKTAYARAGLVCISHMIKNNIHIDLNDDFIIELRDILHVTKLNTIKEKLYASAIPNRFIQHVIFFVFKIKNYLSYLY